MAVQWHRVIDEALAESEVVGVSDAVARHLDRTPTRSELTAARRAAHRHAATGDAQVALLPTVVSGQTRTRLVIARPEVDLGDVAMVRQSVAAPPSPTAKPRGRGLKDTGRRAENLLTQASQVTRAARSLSVDQIAPAHAKLLAEDLTEAVEGLAALAADLTRRSRQR